VARGWRINSRSVTYRTLIFCVWRSKFLNLDATDTVDLLDDFAELTLKMGGEVTVVSANTLQRAIDLVIATPQQDFPVLDGGIVVGIFPSRELMAALQEQGQEALVGDVMRRDFLSVDSNDMLDVALTRVQTSECCLPAPVMQHQKLVGLLTAENVREFLLIASALGERQKQKVEIVS
jgi:Mg2+/Co2+ transporter CorC